MYRYLATNTDAQKKIEQSGGGMMLIYRTEKVSSQSYTAPGNVHINNALRGDRVIKIEQNCTRNVM